jgi:serralysin
VKKQGIKCLTLGLVFSLVISFLTINISRAADTVVLSYLSATNACNWPSSNNYGAQFTAGAASSVTKVRVQYDASTTDVAFNINQIGIYTNSGSNTVGALIGKLNASSIAASALISGATQNTRIGTYTGSVALPSSGTYWLVQISNGTSISACQTPTSVTEGNGWAASKASTSFQASSSGSNFTWASIYSYEISIGAVDTTPPVITGPGGATGSTSAISISENTTSVSTFTANETVTWAVSGTDNSFFAISSGGALTISARDFETKADANGDNVYVVVITATDTASNATTQTLSVTITNVNEAPLIGNYSSVSTYSLSSAENTQSLFTYTAFDPDTGTVLSWSLSGTDSGDFTIGSSNGIFAFAQNPDYEAPADSNTDNIYTVVITVSDGTLTDTQTLTITVTNLNESSTVGSISISGTLYKGVSSPITVSSNVAGRVRFFVDGKRISTCLAISTTGNYPIYIATCNWKSPVMSRHVISATLTPTDNTFTGSTSASTEVFIKKRTTTR